MAEWKSYNLGEIISVRYGKDHKQLKNGQYPVYGSGGYMRSVEKPLSSLAAVLIPRKGTLNNVMYVDRPFWTVDTMFWAPLKDDGRFDLKFVYYRLKLINFDELNVGSAVPSLTVPVIEEQTILVPPLATQRKIAAVLGAIDDKIETNRKICANLEAQAQAIFKSWFVDFDKCVVTTKQMQYVFDVFIGRTPPRKEFEWFSTNRSNNYIWVSIADMANCGSFIADSSEYLTQGAIKKFNFKIAPKGTVLLSFKLTVGRVAIADKALVTNEAIAQLRSNDDRYREYLYCYLKQFDFDKLGSTSSIATAVNSTMIREMPFVVPSESALVEFHNVVAPMFEKMKTLLAESRAIAAMRDALLPKLMSGEIDVSKVEVA